MKKLMVLLCAILLVVGIAGIASADEYWLPDVTAASGWKDVDQSGSDTYMCWAASASNVLAYTEWYGWNSVTDSLISDPDEIYGLFKSSWGDDTGAPFYAYEWWFTDRTVSSVNATKTLDGGGLNFYPGVPVGRVDLVPDTVTMYTSDVNANIPFYISSGRGISLSIDVPASDVGAYAHSLTLWGYDPDNFLLWVTDSDDGSEALRQFSYVVTGNTWQILDYTNPYTDEVDVVVSQATRLNFNEDGIEPRKEGGNGVPEPATLLFLGSGLLGLLYLRKRI